MSAIYNCVLTDATLVDDQLANASYELKMLHDKLQLLRINSDGFNSDLGADWRQSKEGGCMPPTLHDQVTRVVHRQRHQDRMRTYY